MMRTLLLASLALLPALAGAVDPLSIKRARITAGDGQYLGFVGDRFQENSILNRFSPYGDPLSQKSIWNRLSRYGDEFSEFSAFNPHAEHPPKLCLPDRGGCWWLTVNPSKTPRVDPNTLPKPGE
jgi:hypothetical protein